MNNKLFCICLMLGLVAGASAQNTITVDASGNGDYATVQAAVDAAPDNAETTIFIKNGTYAENVNIGSKSKSSTKRLSIIGESRDGTVISSSKGLRLLCREHHFSEHYWQGGRPGTGHLCGRRPSDFLSLRLQGISGHPPHKEGHPLVL